MPDISMCRGEGCARKETCFRAQAKPDEYRQSWFAGTPQDADGSCRYYWPINAKEPAP